MRYQYGRMNLSRARRASGLGIRLALLFTPIVFSLFSFLNYWMREQVQRSYHSSLAIGISIASVVLAGIYLAFAGVQTATVYPDLRLTGSLFGGAALMILTVLLPSIFSSNSMWFFLAHFVVPNWTDAFRVVFFAQLALAFYALFRCWRGR